MRACWTDLRSTKRPSKIGGFLRRFYRYGVKSAHANYTNTDLKSCQAIDPVIMHNMGQRPYCLFTPQVDPKQVSEKANQTNDEKHPYRIDSKKNYWEDKRNDNAEK